MPEIKRDVIIISSDDEDDYLELDVHESDKEGEDAVVKSNTEECFGNCDRSDSLIEGRNDLNKLSLYECQTYLRKHQMRVSETKEECIQRIKEFERLKDGGGESLFPEASFSIDCTGDACRGDVVLFKQNMHDDLGDIIGIRTVAGRIIEESYGASTQQHTFSVEVLWSKWSKALSPLSILLVKGYNLYKLGTFRQRWESEAERLEVLKEKHQRGRKARSKLRSAKQKRKFMETGIASGNYKGTKRQKVFHRGSFQSEPVTRMDTHNHLNKDATGHNQAVWFQNVESQRSIQLTNYSDHQNSFVYPDYRLQEASMSFLYDRTLMYNNQLPYGFTGCSSNNAQQLPNQAFYQPPDRRHHEASLSFSYDRNLLYNNPLPFGFTGCSSNNVVQQEPNQAFFQPPDHRHHRKHKPPPFLRLTNKLAKSRFPKSSFSINCTGDAHVGDVVLFKQLVSLGKNKTKKKRTTAGRIVKVCTCVSKDKPTFMIRVLWATHSLHHNGHLTLPVKSHTLYKFGTFRQPWKKEANRSKMVKKRERAAQKRKLKTDKASNKNKGVKRQKVSKNKPSNKKGQKKGVKLRKTKVKKSKQQTVHPDPNSNPSVSSKPNQNLNQNPNATSSTTPTQPPNPNTHKTPNPILNQHPVSNLNPNPILNQHPDSNLNPNPILNQHPDSNLNPNRTLCMYSQPNVNPDLHQNVNSDANLDPSMVYEPSQQRVWFPLNQAGGYGGQWGPPYHVSLPSPNYFVELFAHNMIALWYLQQPQ